MGIIGIKPNYLLEQGKTAKLKELAVDTGLSAEKVKELAAVGDSITLAQSVGRLGKSNSAVNRLMTEQALRL